MTRKRIEALSDDYKAVKESIDKIHDRAETEKRDLTPEEDADLEKLFDRAGDIQAELEPLEKRQKTLDAVGDIVGRLNKGTTGDAKDRAAGRPVERKELEVGEAAMAAGAYLAEWAKAFHPEVGHGDVEQFRDRAAVYLDRAVAEQTTAGNAGILPQEIVGALIKFVDPRRRVFNSFTSRPMPASGKKFDRPRVTQRTTVGEQAAELDELASQSMILVSEEVTKRTFGGTLRLSQQDIDWTDPAILAIVVTDFMERYTEVTEGAACDVLEAFPTAAHAASAGSGHSAYDDTDVGTLVKSYVDGIVKVYGKSKRMPDTIWHDLASWAVLASTTNGNDDRTALSMIREALSTLGDGAENIRMVTGPDLAANTIIIGSSNLVESYEQKKGLLQAVVPSALATDIATAGYVAFYGRHEGFVALGTP